MSLPMEAEVTLQKKCDSLSRIFVLDIQILTKLDNESFFDQNTSKYLSKLIWSENGEWIYGEIFKYLNKRLIRFKADVTSDHDIQMVLSGFGSWSGISLVPEIID